MDDDFFSEALEGKIEAVEYIVRTIGERDDKQHKYLKIIRVCKLLKFFFQRLAKDGQGQLRENIAVTRNFRE